ncbi:reverse transcriptase domain-containing protein [Tanacetum coccineum]
MRTRSQSRRRRQQQTLPVVENFDLEEPIVEQNVVPMADNRTMAQMLQAPIEGYEDAIVVPPINANNFELKQPLINLVQSNKFTGRQDPHNHLRFFNKVTSTFRHPEVPNTSVKLLLFPFSLDGEARDWLDKEPPRSILTWDDLVSKFINQYFPPSKTTYYRNEIITFYQKPNEAFNEAWERFKGLLRQCPHHGFSELHQLDTFYNSLNSNDQDALDSAAGGNFLDKMPQEGLAIIESKSKVRYSRSRANDSRVSTDAPLSNSSPSRMLHLLILHFPSIPLVPTPVVSIPSKESEQNPETSMNKVQKPSSESTTQVPPSEEEDSIFIEIPKPKAKKTVNVEIQDLNSPRPNSYQSKLPYPKRMKVRENDKPSAQHSRFLKMFKQLRLEIGLKDALVEMPKFNKWLSSLLRNKEKLEEIAIRTVNAECSTIIMNKVPEKLEYPRKFLIPCALQELNRTSALADSGASINLLPHSIYKQLGLGALTPTRMTLELANRSITHPMGIAEDVVVRVDGFTFLADFVVVNFEPDPRVPIILGRPFLRTAKALIDLYEETLTLRVGKEELVYYADKSEKNKDKNFVHAISVIDFSKDDPFSGSTTNRSDDPSPSSSSNVNPLFEENDKDVEIKSSSSFTLTSPEESEFEADSIPPGIDLTLPPTLDVSSSNPTSPTLTREKIIVLLATYLHQTSKPLSRPQEVEEIKEKEDKVSSDVPINTIIMPIRIIFDNPIDFNDHFSKLKDLTKDLTVTFDSTESSILPSPLLDSDSPFTAELSASITLNSLRNEDKVFKPGILVYHAIHDKNLVTLEENLKENISSGTLLVFKEPSFLLPPPKPPDECLNFKPNLVIKNVVLNEDFYQSKKTLPLNVEDIDSFTFIIWTFLPYFTNPEESPLIFSFRSENFVFDPGIVTFHKPVAVSMKVSCSKY